MEINPMALTALRDWHSMSVVLFQSMPIINCVARASAMPPPPPPFPPSSPVRYVGLVHRPSQTLDVSFYLDALMLCHRL